MLQPYEPLVTMALSERVVIVVMLTHKHTITVVKGAPACAVIHCHNDAKERVVKLTEHQANYEDGRAGLTGNLKKRMIPMMFCMHGRNTPFTRPSFFAVCGWGSPASRPTTKEPGAPVRASSVRKQPDSHVQTAYHWTLPGPLAASCPAQRPRDAWIDAVRRSTQTHLEQQASLAEGELVCTQHGACNEFE